MSQQTPFIDYIHDARALPLQAVQGIVKEGMQLAARDSHEQDSETRLASCTVIVRPMVFAQLMHAFGMPDETADDALSACNAGGQVRITFGGPDCRVWVQLCVRTMMREEDN